MAIQVKHKFVSAKVDTLDNSKIQPSNWNDTHDILLAGGVVLGRAAGAGQAAATELPMGAMGQTLLATADAAAARAAIVADATVTAIGAAANKITPVDGDNFAMIDSAAGFALKRTTWLQIKTVLKAYFDTLYIAVGGNVTALQNFVSSTAAVVLAPNGPGGVYLRPNGAASAAGQAILDAAGGLTLSGNLNATQLYRNGTAIPFTRAYESGQQAIANGSLITVAHGLGVQPKMYIAVLQCISAYNGYGTGDEVAVGNGYHGVNSAGLVVSPDAVNINARIGADGMFINRKDNGGSMGAPPANFRLVIRAWA